MFLFVTFPEFPPHSQHKELVDSGTAGNFIDRSFAHSLWIPIVPVDVPFPVHALDTRPLGSGMIREVTAPLGMVTQGGHTERISLFMIDSPAFPVVLVSLHGQGVAVYIGDILIYSTTRPRMCPWSARCLVACWSMTCTPRLRNAGSFNSPSPF